MTTATTLPRALPPVSAPRAPDVPLPAGAVDTHVHMVAAPDDFPLWEGRAEDPAEGSFDDWIALFETHLAALGLSRAVIVHSIFYGGDNSITLATVDRMGRDRARAICLVRDGVDDATLDRLAEAGCAGVRLNYVHGGILSWEGVKAMAPRLAARGMHVQMLMNAHRHMADLADDVRALPVPVVFDHMGWPDIAAGVDEPGFAALRAVVAEGHAWVKLSGLNRFGAWPSHATDPAVRALIDANPERCLWGSDWPHLMLADAPQPDAGDLLGALLRVATADTERRHILVDNPARLYGF